jgi:hypothetical protein
MELQNNNCKSNNVKRELSYQLIERLNYEEKAEKINVFNLKQKHILQKSLKNNYIINKKDNLSYIMKNKNNKKRNLIKELKTSKYFIQHINQMNLLLNKDHYQFKIQ